MKEQRITIAQSADGKIQVCGPDEGADYGTPLEAASCWLIEAGHVPVGFFTVEVVLPDPKQHIISLPNSGAQPQPSPLVENPDW